MLKKKITVYKDIPRLMFRFLAAQGAAKEQTQHSRAESALPHVVNRLESSVL